MSLLEELLQKSSRTFALSIPLLPGELQRSVGVAYLLFRIADTIEDELPGSVEERAWALGFVADRFEEDPLALREALGALGGTVPCDGYAELLERAPRVVEAFVTLPERERRVIAGHLARTCRGMAAYLGRDLTEGRVEDLREYCYIVAGIVGEMLTELFVASAPSLRGASDALRADAAAFGEGLQLVNIIRDTKADIHAGRRYLPGCLDRSALTTMARSDLQSAARYIEALARNGAGAGIVGFNALNAMLAHRTLDRIEESGAGVKLSREQVGQIVQSVKAARSVDAILDALGGVMRASPTLVRAPR